MEAVQVAAGVAHGAVTVNGKLWDCVAPAAIVLEAGGEDLRDDGDNWEILTEPSAYEGVLDAVKKAGITPSSSSVSMIPQNYIKLEGAAAAQMIRLLEALEDQDDVQNVHANFDIDQKLLEEVAG